MFSGIIIAILAVLVIINALLGLRRKALGSIVRLCMLLIAIPVAILVTRLVAGAVGNAILPMLTTLIEEMGSEVTDAVITMADALDALVTMIVAIASFTLIYLIVGLLSKLADKPLTRLCEERFNLKINSRAVSTGVGAGVGAVCGLVLAIAILCPITGLLPVAGSVTTLLGEEVSATPIIADLQSAAQGPACKTVNVLGGDLIFSSVTTTKYKGERVNLNNEASALTGLVAGVVPLSEKDASEWGEEEIAKLDTAADAFDDSYITADIVATLLSDAGAAWGNGEQYLGMECPSMGEMLDPTILTMMKALSSSTSATVRQNIHTLADVIGAMIRYDVFEALQGSDNSSAQGQTDLSALSIFANSEFTDTVVGALYRDEQLRVLIPEVLNLGVRALAQALNVPENHAAVYSSIMDDCSAAFNATHGENDIDRMVKFGDALYEILTDAGVGVSPSTATAMAMGMVADYGSMDTVSSEDMAAWFASYAAAMQENTEQLSSTVRSGVSPLGLAEGEPAILLLGSVTPRKLSGAASAAAYIAAMQKAATPYQILTLTNTATNETRYVVSMSDGSLRVFDADMNALDIATDTLGTLGALQGGEFSSVECNAPWTLSAGPSRVNTEQLAALRPHLSVGSPLPEGYTPSEDSSTTVSSDHLQNAQSGANVITDANSLLAALESAANHELARGTYSAGTTATMSDADSFTSALPCLDAMLISDLDTVCANMTEDSANTVSTALSSLATFLSSDAEEGGDITSLFGEKGSGVVSSLLDSMTAVSGSKDAAVNTLLAGAHSLGADINSLRGTLESDDVSVSEIAGQMLGTTDVLASFNNATSQEEQVAALQDLLANLTESSARAISTAISPNMLKKFGMSTQVANTASDMIRSSFAKLADAKKHGMSDEQFHREADALSAVLTVALHIQEEQDTKVIFGADGKVGKDADTVLDTMLGSNVISSAMIEMVGGTSGAYFTIAKTNPFGVKNLNDADHAALIAAIERVDATLPQLPASNGELWSPQNNQVTRQDTARRLMAFATLFGIEYTTEHANIK